MITETIYLPAYTEHDKTQGIVFDLSLSATKKEERSYHSEGKMATSLMPLLIKVITILKKIQPSWNLLNEYQLTLSGDFHHYNVKQYDSAGLGFAIGLYNIARKINQLPAVEGVVGSGMIRFDGSVTHVRGEQPKESASFNIKNFKKFLTKTDIDHLSNLHTTLIAYL